MKKMVMLIWIIASVFTNICCSSAKNTAAGQIYISKVFYCGDFAIKADRDYMIQNEGAKLPMLLKTWPPSDYCAAPDSITVKAELVNRASSSMENIVIDANIRYKSGILVLNTNGLTNEERSRKNGCWQKSFCKKGIVVKKIAARSKKTVLIAGFNLKTCFDKYGENERPWLCETRVTVKNGLTNGKTVFRTLPIGVER